jgi:hypothetical protein
MMLEIRESSNIVQLSRPERRLAEVSKQSIGRRRPPKELLQQLPLVAAPAVFQDAAPKPLPRLLAPVVSRKRLLEEFLGEDVGTTSQSASVRIAVKMAILSWLIDQEPVTYHK